MREIWPIFAVVATTIIIVSLFHRCRVMEPPDTISVSVPVIKKLTRQAARWLLAAEQDNSVLIAILHVQYGMGYVWAIKDITTPEQFHAATGEDWMKFETDATKIQDRISKRIVEACPRFVDDAHQYMARIAGEM